METDNDDLTNTIRERDRERFWTMHSPEEYVCPDCGREQAEVRRFEVHHIGGVPGNVVGLCLTCHKVRHGADRRSIDLETWKQEFLSLGGA